MANSKPQILFVDDEPNVLASLRRILRFKDKEWVMSFTSNINQALAMVDTDCPDVVVSDLRMPEMSGIDMILEMRRLCSKPPTFILLTGNGDMASAVDAINEAQVFRFLSKPCPADELVHMISDAIEASSFARQTEQRSDTDLAEAALALLAPAIAITDDKGAVCYLNESATEILSARDGLFLDNVDSIRASKSDLSKEIHRAIAEASDDPETHAQFFSIPRPSELRDLTLVVLPNRDGRAALLITDPQRSSVFSSESLSSLFDLTKAEAMIAYTLSNGGSLEEAAEASGLTLSSARTYLKRVFSKTGVSRQSDLVQLVLTTPAPLIRSSKVEKAA